MRIANALFPTLAVLGGILILRSKSALPATPFDTDFKKAEEHYKLPHGLLKKIAWRESRFRPDIISGETKSPAGAIGIMQIVPQWHPLADPYNPSASIIYAANYLKSLHKQFGDWKTAVMAYNWGPGNVSKWIASGKPDNAIPNETRGYIEEVFG